MIEPGGGRRSVARASAAATLRTAWGAEAVGRSGAASAWAAVLVAPPPSAASKKAL